MVIGPGYQFLQVISKSGQPVAKKHPFYQDRHSLFEGAVLLFRRSDSWKKGQDRIWQARMKLEGRKGYKILSLKTSRYDDAQATAKTTYLRLQQMVREGASLRERTFRQAWQEWFSQKCSEGVWSLSRQKWHRNYFNRYFDPYFGERKLDAITMDFANGYWDFRKRYWVDGEGIKQLIYNRRRSGFGNSSTANAQKNPAHKTLLMEQSALNQIFTWCYSKRYMRYQVKLKVTARQRNQHKEARRPGFDDTEWRYLTRNLRSWADGSGKYAHDKLNDFHRHHRQQLRYYVLFIGYTGIRPGTETRWMRWEDLNVDHPLTVIDQKTGLPQRILEIRIRKTGKKGEARNVYSQPQAVSLMREWRQLSKHQGDQDFVFYGSEKNSGEKKPPDISATDFNKTFQSFLRTVPYKERKNGLLNDADDNRRSLYSCRHYYASARIKEGVPYEKLRKSMGTEIEQLARHYDHVVPRQQAAEITRTSFGKKEIDIDALAKILTPDQLVELNKKIAN